MTNPYEVLALAESADAARGTQDEGPAAALRAAGDDVNAAVEYFIEHDRVTALRLVGMLTGFWEDSGGVERGRELTEQALRGMSKAAAFDPAIAAVVARPLLTSSELAFRQGDTRIARKRAQETIRAAVLVEDHVTAAIAHVNLARAAYRDGNAEEMERHARKAMEIGGDNTLTRRGGLHMLAWAAYVAGDIEEAERRFEASLAYRRQVGSRLSIAAEIGNLADLAAERGDLRRAAALHAEALEICTELDSTYLVVNTLPSVAALAADAGAPEDAARLFGAATAITAASGLMPDPGADMSDERDELREELGAWRFDELASEGAALPQEDATALARWVALRISLGEPSSLD